MSDFKVSDIAKKANVKVEDAVNKLADAGYDVKNGNDAVSESALKVFDIDPKVMNLNRRQELLKKAMERHKRTGRMKEVVISKDSPNETTSRSRISREDLLKKKKELEKNLQRVDEMREKAAKEKSELPEASDAVSADAATPAVTQAQTPVDKTANDKQPTQAPETKPLEEARTERPQQAERPERTERPRTERTDRPERTERTDRPRESRPGGYQRDSRPDNRQGGTREGGQREGGQRDGNRPAGRYEGRPDNRQGGQGRTDGRPTGPRPERSDNRPDGRPGGRYEGRTDNRQGGPRPDGRPDSRPGGRYEGRPDSRPGGQGRPDGRPGAPRDGRPGPSRDGRPGAPRDGRPGGFGRPQTQTPVDAPLTDKIWKKKEKPDVEVNKDKDAAAAKKAKAKKPATEKKPKSWTKDIMEGIDELGIEREIVVSDAPEKAVVVDIEAVASDVTEEKAAPKPQVKKAPQPQQQQQHQRPGGHGQYNNNNRSFGRPQRGGKGKRKGQQEEKREIIRPTKISIGEHVVISELAGLMGIKATEIIKKLMGMGIMAAVNQSIDADSAQMLGIEFGIEVDVKTVTEEDLIPKFEMKNEDLVSRPPIVTVMGHVDHGKTSLLDAIRSTSVVDSEAGGITQHIGAYEVDLESGKMCFLDTPGHEAFTMLRARGAQVTDIVVLLVAADDGVMPQTKEAIDHAKAAGVRIIVAINKIDKENANIMKVRQQLAEHGLMGEDWGGDNQFLEISAKNRIGIEGMLESILLEAEMLELKGNPKAPAEGIVIESKLDKQKGPVATVLVASGTLHKGDTFVCGTQSGKVRAMFNYKGVGVKEAGLSIPVEVMGFSEVPESGEKFFVVNDEKVAKQIADMRADKQREAAIASRTKISLSDLFAQIKQGALKELNIIIKADVQGSVEALKTSLMKLSNQEVKVNVIHDGVGGINESDVILASASNAIIIGFNVRPDVNARKVAEREGVDIELYSIIYKAIEDIRDALEGMLTPDTREEVIGRGEVRQVFSVPKIGKVAGSYIQDGKVTRNAKVRVIRNSIVIYDGVLSSLRRFTDDAKEVNHGYECGIGIEKYNDLKEGDNFEFYIMVEEKRTLEDVKRDADKREKEKEGK